MALQNDPFVMQELTTSDAVVDWVIDCPESIPILEKYGIDYCCGGKSLAYACEQRALDSFQVLLEIQKAIAGK
jgi:regulator of cell morphogenesis and NO signaling